MNKKQQNLNNLKVGMSRSRSINLLEENAYTFMLNGQSVDESGNKLTLSNEHSNILASRFKEGFVVSGFGTDIVADKTYFLLLNPTTNVSEFGVIHNKRTFNETQLDPPGENPCTDCDNYNTLSTPLEDIDQLPHQVYETLLTDDCNLCLALDINFPVREIVIKRENIGVIAAFADDLNPPRYIEIDNLSQYELLGENVCNENNQIPTCLDCDKLRIFKLYENPTTLGYERILGGQLKMGVYEAVFAYCDQLGNELSSYISLGSPVSIFDENNVIREQSENNAETNFSIRFNLDGLDQRYTHYKVAVIYNSNETISQGTSSQYVAGVYSTSNDSFIISGNQGAPITKNEILIPKRSIKSWKGLTESNGILFGYGIKENETINLQPVVNLMGLAMKWQSTIAKEDLYAEANANQYKGYNRDEVVPFAIEPISSDGYKYPIYPLITRPARADELIAVDNKDTQSVLDNVSECDGIVRDKKWQFYNTALSEGFCSSDVETVEQMETITSVTSVDVPSALAGTITLSLEDNVVFTDLEQFIEDNVDSCDNPTTSPIEDICPYIDLGNLGAFNNEPNQQTDCEPFSLVDETISIEAVNNEQVTFDDKPIEEYSIITPPSFCDIFEIDNSTGNDKIDEDFSYSYNVNSYINPFGEGIVGICTKFRKSNVYNTSCASALDLVKVTLANITVSNFGSFYHLNRGADTVAELQSTKTSLVTDGTRFTSFVHEGALWFKTDIENRDKFFIELSEETSCDGSCVEAGSEVRVNVFDRCSDGAAIFSKIVDLNTHQFIEVDVENNLIDGVAVDFTTLANDSLYIAVDVPIVPSVGYGPNWEAERDADFPDPPTARFRLAPLCGCFNIVDRAEEFSSVTVSYDSIDIKKFQRYEAECTFNVPVLDDCKPISYEFGEFGFYESVDSYPDNAELFNSSTLDIRPTDFSDVDFRTKFESNYVEVVDSTYTLSDETDFTCKPIRHYRMPDNKVSPFMNTISGGSKSESIIYPLGVTIDNSVVNSFLDIAVRNGLLSQARRDKIIGYKIHRGDSTLYRSIQSSGLLFDMKKGVKDSRDYHFSNFPYNAFGEDKLYNNVDELTDENYLWTFHSPETDYYRPSIGSEMQLGGYQFGFSSGYFDEVQDHAKMTIVGRKARTLATTLAILEVTAEVVISAAQALSNANIWFVGGFTNGASIGTPAYIASGIILGIGVLQGGIANVGRYRYEWLKTFRDLGTPKNFGYYYSSVGNFNRFTPGDSVEDNLRGLSIRKYLKEGVFSVQDTKTAEQITVNNRDRERSVILSSSSSYTLEYDAGYFSYDNSSIDPSQSSQPIASETSCKEGLSAEFIRKIASPYVALKTYISNQYANINSIIWKDTNYQGDLSVDNTCDTVLGGDTFICRHTIKRKMRMFREDAFGAGDLSPFAYRQLSNVTDAKYYIDYEVLSEGETGSTLFPNIDYDVQTDCGDSTSGFYVEPPKKFYLYYYGNPSFLTETRINTNFRNARKELWNQFYPQNLDFMSLTQEKNVSIRRPNTFFYNGIYSFDSTSFNSTTLPDYYSKDVFDKQSDNRNTVMYSKQDINENSLTEPWLVYRPNDYFIFPAVNGELQRMKGIEEEQVLASFENKLAIYNALDVRVDGITTNNAELGTGSIFRNRPRTFSDTDLGYIGSQSSAVLSCEFGHYVVDAKRGQVFNIKPAGGGYEEISRYSGGKPNGMDVWFKEHLPFKIIKEFPDMVNYLDNPYNGFGIVMGWDSKFRRVFITKKDYISAVPLTFENGIFTDNDTNTYTIQEAISAGVLKDVSWTVSYKPEKGAWESYMDFKPNYYIAHTDYFQSGINQSSDITEFGIWSHLLTNKSFRVFYGKKYDWIVEYPTKNQYVNKKLEGVSLWTEAKRYHSSYDYSADDRITFNKVCIFSDRENSGYLNLIPNDGTLKQLSKYPVTRPTEQDILITQNNGKWSFNHIFNRVKSNRNNVPTFLWDENQINKIVNPQAVSFYSKSVLENLSSDVFLIRLEQNGSTSYDLELKFTVQREEIDNN